MKDYVEIGTCFEEALWGAKLNISFDRAIHFMKVKPDLVSRIPAWDEMVWLCVEEYLNSKTQDTSNDELFMWACALLEA